MTHLLNFESDEFRYRGILFNSYTTPEVLDDVCNFQFLPTDIMVATFPRSGTTLTLEIVWQVKNHKTVQKDEKFDPTIVRIPFMEYIDKFYKFSPLLNINGLDVLNSQRNNPYRIIKTHIPYGFIKENFEKVNPKMIVVMRNVKDCLVSNYHFFPNNHNTKLKGKFNEYFTTFCKEETISGSYFENNLEWWSLRNKKNVLILFYEDILLNLPENVKKIANFLDEELTELDVDKIVHNSSFSVMYNNFKFNFKYPDETTFLRKGIVGDWKAYFNEEQNKQINEKIEEKFKESGLEFIYE